MPLTKHNTPKFDRTRALAGLEDARRYLERSPTECGGEALTLLERIEASAARIQQANASFILALLKDEQCTAELFKPWACVRRIRDWRDAGKLNVVIRHGRCCVRPSDFFAFWNTLQDETKKA